MVTQIYGFHKSLVCTWQGRFEPESLPVGSTPSKQPGHLRSGERLAVWLAEPKSARAKDDLRLLGLIKHSWLESGGVYGYRKIHDDLRELGESCGRHRAARLMRREGLRSQTGYRRRPGKYGGKPPVAAPNLLERRFNVTEPNKVWVTDITYIRTYEGWLYLAVVLDLFSRQVIGWSMKPQMTSDMAIDALLMAV